MYRGRVRLNYLSYFVWTLCKLWLVNSSLCIMIGWSIYSKFNSIVSSYSTNLSMVETYNGWSIYDSLIIQCVFVLFIRIYWWKSIGSLNVRQLVILSSFSLPYWIRIRIRKGEWISETFFFTGSIRCWSIFFPSWIRGRRLCSFVKGDLKL